MYKLRIFLKKTFSQYFVKRINIRICYSFCNLKVLLLVFVQNISKKFFNCRGKCSRRKTKDDRQ